MLSEYDDGFHGVFFCLAANMLDVKDLERALWQADESCAKATQREKAGQLRKRLQACAEERGIPLVLRD